MNLNNEANQRDYQNDRRGLGGTKDQGGVIRNEPYKIIDPNSEGQNYDREIIFRRRDIAGGIVSQLIKNCEDQLADLDRQATRLKSNIEYFKKLQASLSAGKELEDN